MLPLPKKYFITAAAAEGETELTAFDGALLKARVGNTNLLRVSSILPPGCEYEPDLVVPPGSLLPVAYGEITSSTKDEIISAAVAVGIKHGSFGVIMEFSGRCSKEESEKEVTKMVEEAFKIREMELDEIKIASVEHKVKNIACAFAAVPLWY
ncbi:Pyruvoyl-dependent arginine decarboxylase [Candidatus Syntrophocurvum alkaliphilum]|uniref:Pyruvoyl-dependent arginine decarboxylase AaxB n=1 Tax=Candidatus Syntrophocurvum alkaliphilum TaxID=2293317 RepID=A0A6I6DHC6_9FIRM|nr:arginine decarboxylase, pyruvoyl-dependent [Candidatus Syntrophocurvum alkaliphilum]QGT99029.1 Pyruvoyl-dependent arginine decarboxylase [Candidatus Syntrophocurvum alkaliphilum]